MPYTVSPYRGFKSLPFRSQLYLPAGCSAFPEGPPVSLHHDAYDISYPPPRKAVLLVTCMDLRLMDDVVQFMDHDNLTNRYDHVTIAGCALGALGANGKHPHWVDTFKDHFKIAHELREFEDVYIIEHRDCGAYKKFLGKKGGSFDDTPADQEREREVHARWAYEAAEVMKEWARRMGVPLNVRSFLMNLRGDVKPLAPPADPSVDGKG